LSSLKADLDRLIAETSIPARILSDPIAFAHRYPRRQDRELAALLAALFAYGRVSLFWPVLTELFRQLDELGGPETAVRNFQMDRDGPRFLPLVYRWNRGIDLCLLFCILRDELSMGGLDLLFSGDHPRQALLRGVDRLRASALEHARECGLAANTFRSLPRGFQYFLPSPADGSACKRWNLFLRWMVRPDDGVDFGLWTHLRPADLVIPLDTHIGRIARFLGLTDRTTDSWDTALAITQSLRRLDPVDPLRYDFAIAHLGISGACNGRFQAEVCPACPLGARCTVRLRGNS